MSAAAALVTPPMVAVICVVPGAKPAAAPVCELIVAKLGALLTQVGFRLEIGFPALSLTAAVNAARRPPKWTPQENLR